MNATQIAVTVVVALAIGGAAIGVFALGGKDTQSADTLANAAPTATSEPTVIGSPLAAPTDVAEPAAPSPDRTSCDEIRGTPYRSASEREYFLQDCLIEPTAGPQPSGEQAPVVAVDTSGSCSTSVEITTTRSDETYDVSGTNLNEIAESLQENAPQVDGETAYGLTEYSYGLNGSFCSDSVSCSLGDISITGDIVVTLPNLTSHDQVSSDVAQIWSNYAESVAIHEGRHVRILEEGLDEIKRQLLLLEEEPDCTLLNHEIDKVWALGGSQIESRQRAFHVADAQGNGGLVVQ